MFAKLFIRILAIFLMIFLGAVARRRKVLESDGARQMAFLITNFFYPALIFSSLIKNFTLGALQANWWLPLGALMVMTIGYLYGLIATRLVPFRSGREKNVFFFQCTINNYSFLPMPLIYLLWGDRGVAALILSTLGSEIAVWTIGMLALNGNRIRRNSLRQFFSVPMIAILLALLVIVFRDRMQSAGLLLTTGGLLAETGRTLLDTLDIFGKVTIPLAMFLSGSRMAELNFAQILNGKQLYLAALRLVVIPASAAGLLFLLPFGPPVRNVLLVLAVMPAAIASVVFSEVYGGDVDFAASSVLVTHLFSLLTIPLWLSFLLG